MSLNAQIIELYQGGLSQKAICSMFGLRPKTTRAILQDAGFNTRVYRNVPEETKRIIRALIKAGVLYREVAAATDISFHVIRDIAEQRPTKGARKKYSKPKNIDETLKHAFLKRYLSGECFCQLCIAMELENKDILHCYSLLDDAVLASHRSALKERLQAEDMSINTVSSLARKYGISASTVKLYLNS